MLAICTRKRVFVRMLKRQEIPRRGIVDHLWCMESLKNPLKFQRGHANDLKIAADPWPCWEIDTVLNNITAHGRCVVPMSFVAGEEIFPNKEDLHLIPPSRTVLYCQFKCSYCLTSTRHKPGWNISQFCDSTWTRKSIFWFKYAEAKNIATASQVSSSPCPVPIFKSSRLKGQRCMMAAKLWLYETHSRRDNRYVVS